MNRFMAGMALILSMFTLSAVAAPAADPQVVVKTAVDNLTARIVKDKQKLQKDPAQLNALIEESIMPYVDLKGIARGVMGRYFRQASPEQFARFTAAFKQSLIRVYANGLTAYNNQKITYLPPAPATDRYTPVGVQLQLDSGDLVTASFQMQRDDQGAWKVGNVVLDIGKSNHFNLGATYRKSFAQLMEQSGNNLDKAIASWSPDPDILNKDKKS